MNEGFLDFPLRVLREDWDEMQFRIPAYCFDEKICQLRIDRELNRIISAIKQEGTHQDNIAVS